MEMDGLKCKMSPAMLDMFPVPMLTVSFPSDMPKASHGPLVSMMNFTGIVMLFATQVHQ